MNVMIAFKLSKGEDAECISLFPQDIAWVMGHKNVIQALSIYSNALLPQPSNASEETKREFLMISKRYLSKLGDDLAKYATQDKSGSVLYTEPDEEDEIDHLTWKKYQIVKSAIIELDNPIHYTLDQLNAFKNILTKPENAKILSKRRDSWLVETAKIVCTHGIILLYHWLMGDQVTEGARKVTFFSAKYNELLRCEKHDSPVSDVPRVFI